MARFNANDYRNDNHFLQLRTITEISDYLGFSRDTITQIFNELDPADLSREGTSRILVNHNALLDKLDGKQQRSRKPKAVVPEVVDEPYQIERVNYDPESLLNSITAYADPHFTGIHSGINSLTEIALTLKNGYQQLEARLQEREADLAKGAELLAQLERLSYESQQAERLAQLAIARQDAIELEQAKRLEQERAKIQYTLGKKLRDGLGSD